MKTIVENGIETDKEREANTVARLARDINKRENEEDEDAGRVDENNRWPAALEDAVTDDARYK